MGERRRGEVDVIICAKLDRFARDTLAGLQQIAELDAMGVDVVVCDIDLDTSTPNGKAMQQMLLVFAELERNTIVDRMSRGMYGKARNGGWPSSRTAAPFGLAVDGIKESARLVIDDEEAATIRKAAALLVDEGVNLADTCRTLNALGMLPRGRPRMTGEGRNRKAVRRDDGRVARDRGQWYPALLRAMLARPASKGVVVWGKTGDGTYGDPVLMLVPAVLSPERWDAVQRALALRPSAEASERRTYSLTGRMATPCGLTYQGIRRSDSGAVQYKCKGKVWQGSPDWKPCDCARLDAATMERRVWAEVASLLSDPARLQALTADYLATTGDREAQEAELDRLDREVAALRQRMSGAVATHIRAGTDPAVVAAAMEQLNGDLAALSKRRDSIARYLADSEQVHQQMTSLDSLAARAAGRLRSMSPDEQREVLDLLGVRVEVLDNTKAPAIRITGTVADIGSVCDLEEEKRSCHRPSTPRSQSSGCLGTCLPACPARRSCQHPASRSCAPSPQRARNWSGRGTYGTGTRRGMTGGSCGANGYSSQAAENGPARRPAVRCSRSPWEPGGTFPITVARSRRLPG